MRRTTLGLLIAVAATSVIFLLVDWFGSRAMAWLGALSPVEGTVFRGACVLVATLAPGVAVTLAILRGHRAEVDPGARRPAPPIGLRRSTRSPRRFDSST